jgi:hypothetical protein
MKYDFKGPKMAFQNIIFKEYSKIVKIMKLSSFMVLVEVYSHLLIWTRIRNPRVTDPDPANVPDPCGSGSTTLIYSIF